MSGTDNHPKISVIIPCYNQGAYIKETLASVYCQTYNNYEIIIVNDGSTDRETIEILRSLQEENLKIITTKNRGLAAARNRGIAEAEGEFILPLDSDDKIKPTYLEKAATILTENLHIGIVYCRAELFGTVEGEWFLPNYTLQGILLENMIFCSALFRKKDWIEAGGYDSGMKYGWEDYEFWLSLIEMGRDVFRIDEILFCYRVSDGSMVRSKELWQKTAMFKRIFNRHPKIFMDNIDVWIEALHSVRKSYNTAKLYIDTGNGFNEKESFCQKVGLKSSKLVFDLKRYKNIQKICFEPFNSYLIFSLKKISIDEEDITHSKMIEKVATNALFVKGETFYFNSKNPQISLNNASFMQKNIETISFEFEYHFLQEEALMAIIEHQRCSFLFVVKGFIHHKKSAIIQFLQKLIHRY